MQYTSYQNMEDNLDARSLDGESGGITLSGLCSFFGLGFHLVGSIKRYADLYSLNS